MGGSFLLPKGGVNVKEEIRHVIREELAAHKNTGQLPITEIKLSGDGILNPILMENLKRKPLRSCQQK